jgi:hypothetical protein
VANYLWNPPHSVKKCFTWIIAVKPLYDRSSLPCITMCNSPYISTIWVISLYKCTSYKFFGSNFIYPNEKKKKINVHKKLYNNNFMSIDQIIEAKNELMSFIYSTWLYIFFTGKLLVMRSVIINSVRICSTDTICLLMFSLVLRYFMSIYLLLFLFSLILKIKK